MARASLLGIRTRESRVVLLASTDLTDIDYHSRGKYRPLSKILKITKMDISQ
jgi:hypothetical protein